MIRIFQCTFFDTKDPKILRARKHNKALNLKAYHHYIEMEVKPFSQLLLNASKFLTSKGDLTIFAKQTALIDKIPTVYGQEYYRGNGYWVLNTLPKEAPPNVTLDEMKFGEYLNELGYKKIK